MGWQLMREWSSRGAQCLAPSRAVASSNTRSRHSSRSRSLRVAAAGELHRSRSRSLRVAAAGELHRQQPAAAKTRRPGRAAGASCRRRHGPAHQGCGQPLAAAARHMRVQPAPSGHVRTAAAAPFPDGLQTRWPASAVMAAPALTPRPCPRLARALGGAVGCKAFSRCWSGRAGLCRCGVNQK